MNALSVGTFGNVGAGGAAIKCDGALPPRIGSRRVDQSSLVQFVGELDELRYVGRDEAVVAPFIRGVPRVVRVENRESRRRYRPRRRCETTRAEREKETPVMMKSARVREIG